MNSNGDVDRVVEEIARREVWLRSYGMAPYTVSAEFDNAQVIRQMIDACKSLSMSCFQFAPDGSQR